MCTHTFTFRYIRLLYLLVSLGGSETYVDKREIGEGGGKQDCQRLLGVQNV